MSQSPRRFRLISVLLLCGASAWAGAEPPSAVFPAPHHNLPHWSYSGEAGPNYWGDLSKEYDTCKIGQAQSPINIVSAEAKKADLPALEFSYQAIPLSIQNNGHTIYVPTPGAGSLKVGSDVYDLVQLHFHTPSEEQIDGKPGDMVVHLVHKNAEGKLAVVGVLLNQGEANPLIGTLWAAMPQQPGDLQPVAGVSINPGDLLPADRNYYTYTGSLTTPPCSEGVRWLVLKQSGSVSAEQVSQYAKLHPGSVRPVQPLNQREVQSSN